MNIFLVFANEMAEKHSQELPSLQQGRVVPGGHYVLLDRLDLQAQQHLSLQENPVDQDNDNQGGKMNKA